MTAIEITARWAMPALTLVLVLGTGAGALAQGDQPTLLGQYADWGAYTASPGGNKVCFALGKPKTTKMEPAGRTRGASYLFVSTRPAEKVKNEVSVIDRPPLSGPGGMLV